MQVVTPTHGRRVWTVKSDAVCARSLCGKCRCWVKTTCEIIVADLVVHVHSSVVLRQLLLVLICPFVPFFFLGACICRASIRRGATTLHTLSVWASCSHFDVKRVCHCALIWFWCHLASQFVLLLLLSFFFLFFRGGYTAICCCCCWHVSA